MLRGGHPGSHAANGPQHPPPPSVSLGYRGLPPQAPSPIPSTSGPHPPPPQACPPPAHDLSNLPPGVREIKPINPASLGGGYSTAHGESSFVFTFCFSHTVKLVKRGDDTDTPTCIYDWQCDYVQVKRSVKYDIVRKWVGVRVSREAWLIRTKYFSHDRFDGHELLS